MDGDAFLSDGLDFPPALYKMSSFPSYLFILDFQETTFSDNSFKDKQIGKI